MILVFSSFYRWTLKAREINVCDHSYTASKWGTWELKPGLPNFNVHALDQLTALPLQCPTAGPSPHGMKASPEGLR